jgi:isochorismate hydrolase
VSLSLFEVAGDKGKNEFVITANFRRLCCMQTSSTAYVCIVVEFMILENTCIKCWI